MAHHLKIASWIICLWLCIGSGTGKSLIPEAVKDELIEGVEIFVGGSLTAFASFQIGEWMSRTFPRLSDSKARALTGGISAVIFVLLAHILHLILEGRRHGTDDGHKVDSTTSSTLSVAQTQTCCPGCSQNFCAIINKKKNKILPSIPVVNQRQLALPVDELFLNPKNVDNVPNIKVCDPSVMYCQAANPPLKNGRLEKAYKHKFSVKPGSRSRMDTKDKSSKSSSNASKGSPVEDVVMSQLEEVVMPH